MKTLELQTAQPLDVARREPSALELIASVIERGITAESVGVMERLVSLKRDMDKDKAERDFAAAFVQLQKELPTIVATSVIPNRGKYERFEDVMHQIQGPLHNNGFSVSFNQTLAGGMVTETCHLTHAGGFTRSNSFTVRSGGKADTETQADCKTSTTAKRNALLNALNIVIRQDCLDDEDDARNIGSGQFITPEQAADFQRRVAETGSDEASFLRFAGAKTYAEIPAAKFDILNSNLTRKEKTT